MINRRFLNFKTYNAFLRALKAKPSLIDEDAIVFVQDKPCIWARGKEYVCDGPYTTSAKNNTLTFRNGNDKTIFKLLLNNGTITVEDSEGNKNSATYVLRETFDQSIENITNAIEEVQLIAHGYVTSDDLIDALSSKLDTLIPAPNGGISIIDNVISVNTNMVTLTVEDYAALVANNAVDRNTYYFTYEPGETPEGNGWHFGDQFPITFTDNWAFGGTFPITFSNGTAESIGEFPITLT